MAATQTPSSARELQGPLFGLLLLVLLLLLLLLLSLLRRREVNTIFQERILKLDENMKWWEKRCKWSQGEYDRRHAALRIGDCHVRISFLAHAKYGLYDPAHPLQGPGAV